MRGISINRSGGIADMLLKVAPIASSAFSDTASNTACKKAGTVITDASNTSQQDTLDIFATKRSIQTPFYSSTFDKNACNDTADALGINEYYSLHLNGAFCEGGFGDNDAKPEVVRCSSPMVVQGVAGLDDLREMLRLDEELQFGAGLDKIGLLTLVTSTFVTFLDIRYFDTYRLDNYRLDNYRLDNYRLDNYRLDNYRLDTNRLDPISWRSIFQS
ncbi:hypothetical protein N0V88_005088 [Collariella sp. IMI 366227]|nr:hypothetical protein N0V88_005088 [Collariella sp. IMI 366227]